MSGDRSRAIGAWQARGLRDVLLPSGTRVQVLLPDAAALARDSRVPAQLRGLALKFAVATVDPATMDEEGLAQVLELQGLLVSRTIRGVWDEEAEAFVPVQLTPAELDGLELPDVDSMALVNIATRRLTPNQVTAQSQRDLGLLSPAEAKQVIDEEAGGTVEAYAPFHSVEGGADPRPNGAAVGVAPEQPAGDTGPSPSVGA
jgi:hypothetical protein